MCTRHPRFLLYWRLKLSKSVRPVCMTVCNYRVSHTYLWIHRGEKRKTCNHDSIRRERERDIERSYSRRTKIRLQISWAVLINNNCGY